MASKHLLSLQKNWVADEHLVLAQETGWWDNPIGSSTYLGHFQVPVNTTLEMKSIVASLLLSFLRGNNRKCLAILQQETLPM